MQSIFPHHLEGIAQTQHRTYSSGVSWLCINPDDCASKIVDGLVTFDTIGSQLSTSPGTISSPSTQQGWNLETSASSSYSTLPGDALQVSFRCPYSTIGDQPRRMLGLVHDNDLDVESYANLAYAICCENDGSIKVYESGVHKSTYSDYSNNPLLKIYIHIDGTV